MSLCPKCNGEALPAPVAGMLRCKDCAHYFKAAPAVPGLIECPACKKPISPNAKACPGCGEPVPQAKSEFERKSDFAGMVIIVVVLIVVAIFMLLGAIRKISG